MRVNGNGEETGQPIFVSPGEYNVTVTVGGNGLEKDQGPAPERIIADVGSRMSHRAFRISDFGPRIGDTDGGSRSG